MGDVGLLHGQSSPATIIPRTSLWDYHTLSIITVMAKSPKRSSTTSRAKRAGPSTRTDRSAGGVAFRKTKGDVQIALISVSDPPRWQLPKGHLDEDETPEEAALREVCEETGIEGKLLAPIDTIDYWFYATKGDKKVRLHKYVGFYLMSYRSGDVRNHDEEVHEARWFPITSAIKVLAFKSERRIVEKARRMIADL